MFKNFPYKKVLFIGIGGIGISALAKLLFANGYKIYGINDQKSPQTLKELTENGVEIKIKRNDEPENLSEFDAVVYSTAWDKNFPNFMQYVKDNHRNVFDYSKTLSIIAKNFFLVAVSGSHGKTTTTAMICHAAQRCGLKPNCIVGSLVNFDGVKTNFLSGESNLLIIEACEYQKHFLYYKPDIAVVTNIDYEHADFYKSEEEFKNAFKQFMQQSKKVIKHKTRFDFIDLPMLQIPGEHNKENALLALDVLHELGADMLCVKNALQEFKGTWRRIEYKGKTKSGAIVYDDYAHHPTEIKATIEAIHSLHKDKKIVTVFEPHTYSRTKAFFNDFVKVFSNNVIDKACFVPTYPAREKPIKNADAKAIYETVKNIKNNTYYFENFDIAKDKLETLADTYVLLLMGAGDIYLLAEKLTS